MYTFQAESLQKNTLQITLVIGFIALFLNSFNVHSDTMQDKTIACTAAMNKGDYKAAVTIADDILKSDGKNKDGLLCKGRALGFQGNYAEGLSNLEAALKQSSHTFDQILANIFIGNLHKNNQQYEKALASYDASVKQCELDKNDKFRRIAQNLMGDTYTLKGDVIAALASYQAGAKVAMNDNERAESFEKIAAANSTLNKLDAATEYQVKATLLQERSGTRDEYAMAGLTLGRIYTLAKDYPAAENTYAKLIKFSKTNGSEYYETKANFGLAQTKAAKGDTSAAKTMMTNALAAAKNMGEGELAAEIEESLKKIPN